MTLQRVLDKLENDSRYNDGELRARVFNMFLPLIIMTSDIADRLSNLEDSKSFTMLEQKLILCNFLSVLRYMDRAMLLQWLEKESEVRYVTD